MSTPQAPAGRWSELRDRAAHVTGDPRLVTALLFMAIRLLWHVIGFVGRRRRGKSA